MKQKYIAVRDGSTRMLHPAIAEVLKKKGVVRDYETDTLVPAAEVIPAARSVEESAPAAAPRVPRATRAKKEPAKPAEAPRARRTYQRRDMKAET